MQGQNLATQISSRILDEDHDSDSTLSSFKAAVTAVGM